MAKAQPCLSALFHLVASFAKEGLEDTNVNLRVGVRALDVLALVPPIANIVPWALPQSGPVQGLPGCMERSRGAGKATHHLSVLAHCRQMPPTLLPPLNDLELSTFMLWG